MVTALLAQVEEPAQDLRRTSLARHFGFGPMQIYKVRPAIMQLKLADLKGDGRLGVALWNPKQSRIELFFQADRDAPAPPAAVLERNELADRGPLRREHVPVPYRLAAMEVGEFTGDDRPDIVFFGEPRELVILPGRREGGFGSPVAMRAPEGNPRPGALAVGDFNSDGRQDVALLGENVLLLFLQKEGGGLSKPLRHVHNVPRTLLMLPADLNGDGRDDLIIGVDDDEFGAIVFLQDASGALGAVQRVRTPKLRSITVARTAGGDDIFSVEAQTERLRHLRWETPAQVAPGEGDWPMWLYSYPVQSRSRQQPVAVGDVTGDGLADVVAVDPDAAQMILFEGSPTGLRPGVAFPGLMKTLDVSIADLDGDGSGELLLVSAEEKTIGVSEYREGRLTFPAAHPRFAGGKPLAAVVGSMSASDARPSHLAYVAVVKTPGGDESREVTALHVVPPEGDPQVLEIPELRDEAALRFADVNQDGRSDLLLFVRFSPLITFLQGPDGRFERLEGAATRSELVKDATIEGFDLADVNGDGKPEVLLAQKNMARALAVREGRWTVIDQYNPEAAEAEITGVAALPPGVVMAGPPSGAGAGGATGRAPVLALYDRKAGEVLVFAAREDRSYAVVQGMRVGPFELRAMQAAPLAAGGRAALLMADARKLAVLVPQERAATLVEKHSYETDLKDVNPSDAALGDLNGDGVRDVVLVDTAKAYLEILTTLPDGDLAKVMHFQVFQGKRFSEEPERGGEPREVLVGDVTGDGIDDLVLIVHDRLIVYPGQ
jgi:hypothetical protein